MKRSSICKFLAAAACSLALLFSTTSAFADKVYFKDGRVVEAKVLRNEGGIVVLEYVVDGKTQQGTYGSDEILKIVPTTTDPAPAKADKPSEAKADKKPKAKDADTSTKKADAKDKNDKAAPSLTGRATRIAILNFGAPRSWQGSIDSMVGREINAWAWAKAVPMLEKDKVDVVVVRINSGGGYSLERQKFQDVYEKMYKPRFRLVGWVESAISAAAMSPYCIEEFYFLPEGNLGGCTSWSGDLQATTGFGLAEVLMQMEETSRLGKRDPRIMRSMQITEPLSCNIDEDGNVTWFQDLSGKFVVNPPGQILTFTANDAVKYKFAKGIAATKEELAKAMGYTEVEWVGKEATEFIDQNMRDCDRTNKRISELDYKYGLALGAARQLRGPANKQLRSQEIGKARQALTEMKKWMSVNPNFEWIFNRPQAWFDEQERILKELARD